MTAEVSLTVLFTILVLLIVASACFSGSETAMMAVNRYRLRHQAKEGSRSARMTEKLLKHPDKLLGTILIGNTFANIIASSLATIIALRLWGEVGLIIAPVLLTLVILIFGEAAPKTIAAIKANRIAPIISWPLYGLLIILYPIVLLVNSVSNLLLKLLRIKKPTSTTDHFTSDELRTVVAEASGRIPSRHKRMLLRILDLKEMTVNDIMVPRNEICGIDISEDWDDILEQLRHAQHTRLPVYSEAIENIIGIIHVRDVVNFLSDDIMNDEAACKAMLREHANEVYFVPEETPLTTQLLNFQNKKVRIGMVVDEYGDIQGLATLEDILEEIVGEFTTDMAATIPDVHPQEDGTFLVDGGANIRELNRSMHWDLPTDGPKTLSGLIIETLEFMPTTEVGLKINGYPMEVIAMKAQKIKTVKLFPR